MTQTDLITQKRQDCWNGALHAFGYGYLYNQKAGRLKKLLKFNAFLGILIPLLIGAVVTTYGLESNYLEPILFISAPISILQLVLSVWIVTNNLEDVYSYYLESSHDNYSIATEYENLAKYPPKILNNFDSEIEKINIKRNHRDLLDNKHPVTDKEKRKGMRYSLRKFKRSCGGCNEIPIDMIATDCGVCGKF